MKTTFETDEFGLVTEFPYHDAIFEELVFSKEQLSLVIRKTEGAIKIILSDVCFVEVMELIPKGIVLSCYSFPMSMCPKHLGPYLCFDKVSQFVANQDISVFYIDGTMGFELLVCHGHGRVEVEQADEGKKEDGCDPHNEPENI